MATLYGIRNCDTVRKARKWLDANRIEVPFHDLRDDGLDAATVGRWLEAVGEQQLVNRRSRTWRDLPVELRETGDDRALVELLLAHPTLIRRPVLESGDEIVTGFATATYRRLFDLQE